MPEPMATELIVVAVGMFVLGLVVGWVCRRVRGVEEELQDG